MTVFDKVNMTFASNTIRNYYANFGGGTTYLKLSNFIVKNAVIQFFNNLAKGTTYGRAIFKHKAVLINIRDCGAVKFLYNTSLCRGGAIFLFIEGLYIC